MGISSYNDKDKIFINSDNDVTYKAEWLALEINRSLRMNIAEVDIDWKSTLDIIMKEFKSDISLIKNERIQEKVFNDTVKEFVLEIKELTYESFGYKDVKKLINQWEHDQGITKNMKRRGKIINLGYHIVELTIKLNIR
ncbi:hypothetical protein RhiirB3_443247 [Rhizophagus irregularis]|nr:hypothetical protein RhiirB3_443247 [Rhizophagus irregularis]